MSSTTTDRSNTFDYGNLVEAILGSEDANGLTEQGKLTLIAELAPKCLVHHLKNTSRYSSVVLTINKYGYQYWDSVVHEAILANPDFQRLVTKPKIPFSIVLPSDAH